MTFINRQQELEFLQRKYNSNKAELILIYGRRRIGKTELINEFSKRLNAMYFFGRSESKKDTTDRFNLMFMEFFNDISLVRSPLQNWDQFFDYLEEKSQDRIVLIIDEFPLIVDKFPEILSILQDKWDNILKNSRLMLILCGSSVSMMEKYTLDYQSPLYGRRTGQWLVDKLDIIHLRDFFPIYTTEDLLILYSTIDSIPGYLIKFSGDVSIWENIESNMLSKGEFLYEEVEILLREEMRDPSNYMSILSAVAGGLTSFNEIYNKTGLDKSLLSKYLFVLDKLKIIKKNLPITDSYKGRLKARGAKYSINDNFFDFWFRFVFPNLAQLELGNSTIVLEHIKKDFPPYLGGKFEQFVIELFPHLGLLAYTRIGKWWFKDKEIDIVAINEMTNDVLFCECKWQERKTDVSILEQLMNKAVHVEWNNDIRKNHYAVFSKSGFTVEAEKFADNNNFKLISLQDLDDMLIY
jgi:AAA+ ATPase superfamily predicted ATPase